MNSYCSNFIDMRNLQEQVKKAFCYQKLFWPFTVWINCPSDLKHFANSRPSVLNFKSFTQSLEQFFLTVGQKNFGNKIPMFHKLSLFSSYFLGQKNRLGDKNKYLPRAPWLIFFNRKNRSTMQCRIFSRQNFHHFFHILICIDLV